MRLLGSPLLAAASAVVVASAAAGPDGPRHRLRKGKRSRDRVLCALGSDFQSIDPIGRPPFGGRSPSDDRLIHTWYNDSPRGGRRRCGGGCGGEGAGGGAQTVVGQRQRWERRRCVDCVVIICMCLSGVPPSRCTPTPTHMHQNIPERSAVLTIHSLPYTHTYTTCQNINKPQP